MSNKKLERVLQLIINEENNKASDLLHDIFVEKARNIYLDIVKEDEDLERIMSEADDDEYDFDVSDMEDDLEDDVSERINTYDSEIDSEEMYEADDDEEMDMDDEMGMDDAEMDLAGEMGDDMGDEMDMDMGDEMDMEGEGASDADEAFMNVEDALEELKSYFADLVGDESDEESEDEFAADEYEYDEEGDDSEMGDEMDMDDEMDMEDEDEEEIKESVQLKKVSEPAMKGGDDGKASPVAKGKGEKLGKPMKDAIKNTTETGGKAEKPKEMGYDGPESVGTKLKPASVRKMKG